MRISDITVEVRDDSFNRIGQILPKDLVGFKAVLRFNNVGSWEITLPAGHEVGEILRLPGSGIIVTGPTGVLLSGPTMTATNTKTKENAKGQWLITGVDDSVVLGERLAYPDPTNPDVTTQANAYDTRPTVASTAMYGYVSDNIGPTGASQRRILNLDVDTDPGIGSTVYPAARFDILGELLAGIASVDGLGFDIKQEDGILLFSVYQPTDRSGYIRMDVANNTLSSTEYAYGSHALSRAIVAGQGEGVDRVFVEVTSSESLTAETVWGRRIETFVDQRNTADANELTQAGIEKLADGGATLTSVDVVPSNDMTMAYGEDWGLGDKVTVVVDDQEVQAVVTAVSMSIEADGIRVGATVGEPTGVDYESKMAKRTTNTAQRVNALERKEGGSGGGGAAGTLTQEVKNDDSVTLQIGQAVYISGANGTNVLVKRAQGNAELTSSKTLGLVATQMATNEKGTVITEGFLAGLDTSSASDGDPVWLSPTTPGGLVYGIANKPTAPNHLVFIGFVLRANANNGEIYVKVQNGFENDELHDRLTYIGDTAPANGKDYYYWFDTSVGALYFRYNDGTSSQWVEAVGATPQDLTTRVATAEANINLLDSRTDVLEATDSSTLSRVTALETSVDAVKAGFYIRQVEVQVDTTNRTFGSWALGPTFPTLTYRGNSKIKMMYHIPMRNDASGWGGMYVEPQVQFNGGAWQSLGSTGHEMMHLGNADIATYKNDILIEPGISTTFTAAFRFYVRAYEGTVGWNNGINHDINVTSGTATIMSGNNGNQHYMHIIIEEFAKA